MATVESSSIDLGPSPLKKQKTEINYELDYDAEMDGYEEAEIDGLKHAEVDEESGSEVDSIIDFEGDIHGKSRKSYLVLDLENDDCLKELVRMYYQRGKSEGFEIDWSLFKYRFRYLPVVWKEIMPFSEERSDKFVKRMTLFAIDEHNRDKGGELKLVKIVKANYYVANGQVLFITFLAKDLASSNPHPILFQTEVWNLIDKITVCLFRRRPSDEEIAAVQVNPPPALYFPGKPPEFYSDVEFGVDPKEVRFGASWSVQ